MRVRSLKARLLLNEAKGPVPGLPSASPHTQYKPRTLSLQLHSHEAQAGAPSRASFPHHTVDGVWRQP